MSGPAKSQNPVFAFDKAKDKGDRFVYHKKTGILAYDKDGSGQAAEIAIVKLKPNAVLTACGSFPDLECTPRLLKEHLRSAGSG